jgi:hypothetical protein
MTQCRTGHAFTGEYYERFNIPEETACPCGEARQTRRHVLLDCPLYEEHRDVFDNAEIEHEEEAILGTDTGLAALAEFLKRNGAFTKTGRPRPDEQLPTWEDELARELMPEEEDDEADMETEGESEEDDEEVVEDMDEAEG